MPSTDQADVWRPILVSSTVVVLSITAAVLIQASSAVENGPESIQPLVRIARRIGVGESFTHFVEIRNNSSVAIEIVGGTANCTCMTLRDLPCTFQPNEIRLIPVKFYSPDSGEYLVTLYINDGSLRQLQTKIDFTAVDN